MEEIIEKIIAAFSPGDLITHSFLREQFNIVDPAIEDFKTTDEFVAELQNIQFNYMTMVDKLRFDLLTTQRYYLKNVRGDGYTLLPPKEQVTFAYDQALTDIKKSIKQAKNIMSNMRFEEVSPEQAAKDVQLFTKMDKFAQMFAGRRN